MAMALVPSDVRRIRRRGPRQNGTPIFTLLQSRPPAFQRRLISKRDIPSSANGRRPEPDN